MDAALGNAHLSGITLFQFFDIKVGDDKTRRCPPCDYLSGVEPPTCGYIHAGPYDDYPWEHACGRPGGLNHKGVLDPWRRKKEAYYVVATKFNSSKNTDLQWTEPPPAGGRRLSNAPPSLLGKGDLGVPVGGALPG